MLLYNPKVIESFIDVKKEFPSTFDSKLVNKKVIKGFSREFLDDLVDTAHDTATYNELVPKPDSTYERIYRPAAQAKAVYRYLWCRDFITEQMMSWGWNHKDLDLFIKRMERSGYDPYSTTEPTAGRFIESLPGYGYKTVISDNGEEYKVYNPKGYGQLCAKSDETDDY